MAWVRIDDEFYQHPKVLQAGPLGIALFVAGLCYCNRYLTDGFIPASAVPTLCNFDGISIRLWQTDIVGASEDVTSDMVADLLVEAGLWEEVEGGYRVHDFHDYQPSRSEVLAEREKKRAAGRKGGLASARARKAQVEAGAQARAQADAQSDAFAGAQADAQAGAQAKSKPVPVPDPVNTPQDTCVNEASSSLRSNTVGTGADDADQRMDGQADDGAEPAAVSGERGDADSPSRPLPGSVVAAEMMAEMTDEQRLIHDAYFAVTGRLLTSKDLECLHELLEIATPELIANTIREVGERARESGTKPRSLRYFADAVREAVARPQKPAQRLDYELPDPDSEMERRRAERARWWREQMAAKANGRAPA